MAVKANLLAVSFEITLAIRGDYPNRKRRDGRFFSPVGKTARMKSIEETAQVIDDAIHSLSEADLEGNQSAVADIISRINDLNRGIDTVWRMPDHKLTSAIYYLREFLKGNDSELSPSKNLLLARHDWSGFMNYLPQIKEIQAKQ